jgi:hypothetical protein
MGENHTTPGMAREQGRDAALAGREIFVNPHVGVDAVAWFDGYREVPEELRGSQPELMTASRKMTRREKRARTGLPQMRIAKASMAEGPHR